MAFSAPRILFGIHSFTPYNRTTGLPYGEMRVLQGSSVTLEGELIELFGGSNKYSWAVEDGKITSDISLVVDEFPSFAFELFLGKAPTDNAAETTGNVSTITDKFGTSIVDAATGIASVTALSGSEADMKFGKYTVIATSATAVDVYISSDVDLARGTNGTVQNDTIKITASPLTITSGGNTTVPNFGIKFTGGSGAIAFTTGHTATFEVRPVNSKSMTVTIGATADTLFPEFGAYIYAQKRGNQELMEIDALRCKAIGMPLDFNANEFAEAEINIKTLYDSDADAVLKIRHVSPSNT